MIKHASWDFKCKLDSTTCNSNQTLNNDKWQCTFKEYHKTTESPTHQLSHQFTNWTAGSEHVLLNMSYNSQKKSMIIIKDNEII